MPTGRIFEGYKYAFSRVVLDKILEEKISHLYKCFTAKFLKSFWVEKTYLYLFLKGWKI